ISGPVKYSLSTLHNPERLVIDLRDTRLRAKLANVSLTGSPVIRLRSGIRNGDDTRLVLELNAPLNTQSEATASQLLINLIAHAGKAAATARQESATETRPGKAIKTADGGGQRDVIIAIDAGHGGDDPGAIGAGRLEEKRVALAIARELSVLFERERGYKPVLTRKGDYFLPLKTRRDLARKAQADLMVSIHADAFADKGAQGGSVFALSDRGATSTMAAFLADSENNADAIGGVPVEGKDDDLVKVLTDLSLTATMDSSLHIGKQVLNSMSGITRLHSKRVEQAAFVVLKSPDTPSILVETGFVSNPKEARRLASSDYQKQIAHAIFNGVDHYFSRNPPPNTYLASKRNAPSPGVRSSDTVASALP
ncbi:MAG TPA: N-acetylmuramoyl-L-alanine amidase, partial [Spongiibacteraceae bacterium]